MTVGRVEIIVSLSSIEMYVYFCRGKQSLVHTASFFHLEKNVSTTGIESSLHARTEVRIRIPRVYPLSTSTNVRDPSSSPPPLTPA